LIQGGHSTLQATGKFDYLEVLKGILFEAWGGIVGRISDGFCIEKYLIRSDFPKGIRMERMVVDNFYPGILKFEGSLIQSPLSSFLNWSGVKVDLDFSKFKVEKRPY